MIANNLYMYGELHCIGKSVKANRQWANHTHARTRTYVSGIIVCMVSCVCLSMSTREYVRARLSTRPSVRLKVYRLPYTKHPQLKHQKLNFLRKQYKIFCFMVLKKMIEDHGTRTFFLAVSHGGNIFLRRCLPWGVNFF